MPTASTSNTYTDGGAGWFISEMRVRGIAMRLENVADKKRPCFHSMEMADLRDEKSA